MDLEKRLAELRAKIKSLLDVGKLDSGQADELKSLTDELETVKMQIKAQKDISGADEAEVQAREEELEKAKEEAVAAAKKEWEAEAAKSNRLPGGATAYVTKYDELNKYDNLSTEDQAVLVGVLNAIDGSTGGKRQRASANAMKALAIKISENKEHLGFIARNAMKAQGLSMKSDELMQQNLTSGGDEWVGVAYSQALWEAVRAGSQVVAKIPSFEVPAGHESITLPLEGADPTYYKVAEAEDAAASGWPNATITSSQAVTGNTSLSLAKMGARVLWSGELEEDSLIPFVAQLRRKLEVAGSEQLEHAVIDGDTATATTTNINDIGNLSAQAGTELYLMFNGFRKLALANNGYSVGTLDETKFLEVLKLMGTAGLNGADVSRVSFILDGNVRWKALEIEAVKNRDVYVQPTIENGMLNSIFGYPVMTSYNMHYKSANRKVNTAGKVDQTTTSNNTTGSFLAVRWDQWQLGYRRRMSMETTRIARADATEIVALMRLGLINRDTEACAIGYNVTV